MHAEHQTKAQQKQATKINFPTTIRFYAGSTYQFQWNLKHFRLRKCFLSYLVEIEQLMTEKLEKKLTFKIKPKTDDEQERVSLFQGNFQFSCTTNNSH